MIRIGGIILLLIIELNSLWAQEGDYLVAKHTPAIDQQNVYYRAIIDGAGITYLASRNGLIKYDGQRATLIDVGGSVFDVAINDQQTIFIGTSIGFMKLAMNEVGKASFVNLMPVGDYSTIDQVLTSTDGVYALTDKAIYYRASTSDTTIVIEDDHAGRFHNIYELDGHIYVNSENKGTMKVVGDKVSSEIPAFLDKETVVFSMINPKTNQYICASTSGALMLLQDGVLSYLNMNNQRFADAEPITAVWYDAQVVVVGTLKGGVFFVNTKTGSIVSNVDYNAGLEDNEVRALTMDKNKGISVISHFAMTHISCNLPIKSFQYYDGLVGDITSAVSHQNRLYVGTNVGLYRLEQITDYEEVVSYKERRIKKKMPQAVNSPKKGLFGLKRRKRREEPESEESELVITEKKITQKATDIYHVYKEVDDQISHTSQILVNGSGLIVGGLSGAFEILDDQVVEISKSDVQYMYLSKDADQLFLCTGDEQVLVYARQDGQWVYKDVFTDFRARVSHIIAYEEFYWLCSPDRIYKMKLSNNELEDVQEYAIENPYQSTLYATVGKSGLKFINANGSFILEDDTIKYTNNLDKIDNIILDHENNIWTFSKEKWQKPNEKNATNSIFGIFNGLKHIAYHGANSSYWIVTADNELMTFDKEAQIPTSAYSPYLEDMARHKKKFVVEQDENKLQFIITCADLPDIMDTKYRHQLKGFEDKWSNWSTESTINFAFLPAGNYTLMIETQNVLGQSNQISPVSFEVLPPYWKQPLFYVFEIVVVLLLFLLSIKLKSWGNKFRLISRLLAFLTLVIILEYMEAIMESYFLLDNSPVFSFTLQVVMAMIILPFEGVLKKYVFKDKIDLGTYFELKGKKYFGES
jgi:hypothetical protein